MTTIGTFLQRAAPSLTVSASRVMLRSRLSRFGLNLFPDDKLHGLQAVSTDKVRAGRRIIKAARVFLLMEQEELATAAKVTRQTLSSFELGKMKPHEQTRRAIQEALEARGIVFTNGGRPGFYFERPSTGETVDLA